MQHRSLAIASKLFRVVRHELINDETLLPELRFAVLLHSWVADILDEARDVFDGTPAATGIHTPAKPSYP